MLPTSSPKIRSLADDIRGRSDEQLAALLASRPDLARPAPSDLTALASRSSTRASTARAIDGLDTAHLQVLEAAAVGGEAVTVQALARLMGDADLDRAAEFVTKGILQNAGQTCSAGSRLIVHKSVRAELVAMLAARFRATSLGRGSDDPDLGPLISRKQQDRVRGYVEGASSGEVIVGGGAPQDESLTHGSYWLPTLIDDVDPASVIAQEEVFGPVLITLPFTEDDEAVALANGTDYGLISAIWTKDVSRAHRVATQIQSGQVYVNTYGAGGGVELPFGGFKHSGYGREKGVEALDAFTQTKTVVIHLG